MTPTTSLNNPPADLIAGRWIPIPGDEIRSTNPARPGAEIWSGLPVPAHAGQALESARAALPAWAAWTIDQRVGVLRRYQELAKSNAEEMANLIAAETGKAMWECKGEAGLLAAKVDITLEEGPNTGRSRVTAYDVPLNETKSGRCWFRPHGVMSVIGPFNFPAHLPNGHIVPALLTGNTIVFKPSDKTPAVGQRLAELFQQALEEAGAPEGVFNLVQGGADIASHLVSSPEADGVLFTGSWPVGRKILEANLDQPGKIIALEMGGNNPAVVMPSADLHQAAVEIVRCAFNTTGQRCTSTRRAIIHASVADRLISAIVRAAEAIAIGDPMSNEPVFMGPIITEQAREAVFAFEKRLAEHGGEVLLSARQVQDPIEGDASGWYVSPSVVRVPRFDLDTDDCGCDEELFGPLLRIAVVGDLDEAIKQANATRYGLAASIFSQDPAETCRFLGEARAGCVNVNCGTACASSKLPFGGLGWSGNHRPAGAFALDYTAIPIAGMIETGDASTMAPGMTLERDWLA
ncbi:MAG: aldehyde dehydrogenase family protein [Phycisphaerales bacterium JB059]